MLCQAKQLQSINGNLHLYHDDMVELAEVQSKQLRGAFDSVADKISSQVRCSSLIFSFLLSFTMYSGGSLILCINVCFFMLIICTHVFRTHQWVKFSSTSCHAQRMQIPC